MKGNGNIISNSSGIAVADGQCMMIVEQGEVVEKADQQLVEMMKLLIGEVEPD